jgi:hypothetical protein
VSSWLVCWFIGSLVDWLIDWIVMLPGTVGSKFLASANLHMWLGIVAREWTVLTPLTRRNLWPAKSENYPQLNVDAQPYAHAHVFGRKRGWGMVFFNIWEISFLTKMKEVAVCRRKTHRSIIIMTYKQRNCAQVIISLRNLGQFLCKIKSNCRNQIKKIIHNVLWENEGLL